MTLDPAKLESLVVEGWRARIKTVKNRKYIAVRKGGKERSLGPFTEELWSQLEQAGLVKRDPNEALNIMQKSLDKAVQDIAELKQKLGQEKPTHEVDEAAILKWRMDHCFYANAYRSNNFCSI